MNSSLQDENENYKRIFICLSIAIICLSIKFLLRLHDFLFFFLFLHHFIPDRINVFYLMNSNKTSDEVIVLIFAE